MRIELHEGFYQTRILIADAQRCINLYPEVNQQASTAQVTHYPTPGLSILASAPGSGGIRGVWAAQNGKLFVAQGSGVYAVDASWNFTLLGNLTTTNGHVSMMDNGQQMIVVDGTATGFRVDINALTWTQITDSGFFGGDRVEYVDGFFVLNEPGTGQFYVSDVQAATFSTPAFATKEAYPDPLSTLIVMHRELWLLGTQTSEIYFNAGGQDFPFQLMPGAFIEHGCIATHSVAKADVNIFWLGSDLQGRNIVFRGNSYQAVRISTHAIEEQMAAYGTVSDAIGFTYQQEGHSFYVLTFPSADATWVYDMATGLWHERAWMDAAGTLHRHRANCHTVYNGMNVVGDWQNGNLYKLDVNTFTDNGQPILRLRSFPTLDQGDKRMRYNRITLDMQTGIGQASGPYQNPLVDLRWSDDGGYTWGNKVQIDLGGIGDYLLRANCNRLGYGRRRVFEVSWALPMDISLQGAWIDAEAMRS